MTKCWMEEQRAWNDRQMDKGTDIEMEKVTNRQRD
jgi:hypothetical protein